MVQAPFYKEKLIRWDSVKLCACQLMKARFMRTSSFGGYLCEINGDNDNEDTLGSQILMIVTFLTLIIIHTLTNYHLSSFVHTCTFLAMWLLLKDAVKNIMSIRNCLQTTCFFFDWQSAYRFDGDAHIAAISFYMHTCRRIIIIYSAYHTLLYITASWNIIPMDQHSLLDHPFTRALAELNVWYIIQVFSDILYQ